MMLPAIHRVPAYTAPGEGHCLLAEGFHLPMSPRYPLSEEPDSRCGRCPLWGHEAIHPEASSWGMCAGWGYSCYSQELRASQDAPVQPRHHLVQRHFFHLSAHCDLKLLVLWLSQPKPLSQGHCLSAVSMSHPHSQPCISWGKMARNFCSTSSSSTYSLLQCWGSSQC